MAAQPDAGQLAIQCTRVHADMNHQSTCVVSQAIRIFAVCGEKKYDERLKQSRN